uniref:Uncharacterized protein n=1 Tax=Terrapene triunguis TaxID=2587831 RepID=A0A674HZH1_9SAUR
MVHKWQISCLANGACAQGPWPIGGPSEKWMPTQRSCRGAGSGRRGFPHSACLALLLGSGQSPLEPTRFLAGVPGEGRMGRGARICYPWQRGFISVQEEG